ncbi:MAG: hypothetical protein IKE43_01855 [Coriobacteriales bacterium]|nr:hypothetical protein [Coriobacteriales bacterium]
MMYIPVKEHRFVSTVPASNFAIDNMYANTYYTPYEGREVFSAAFVLSL